MIDWTQGSYWGERTFICPHIVVPLYNIMRKKLLFTYFGLVLLLNNAGITSALKEERTYLC
jgi:hypothetical protein